MKSYTAVLAFLGLITVSTLAKEVIVDLTAHKHAPHTVSVVSGDKMIIQLDENPTTGFSWNIVKDKTSNKIPMLALTNTHFTQKSDDEFTKGQAGVKSFTFEALYAGHDDVEFVYAKIWELEKVLSYNGTVDLDKAHHLGFDVTLMSLAVESLNNTTQ